jgi:hypothetical protein
LERSMSFDEERSRTFTNSITRGRERIKKTGVFYLFRSKRVSRTKRATVKPYGT